MARKSSMKMLDLRRVGVTPTLKKRQMKKSRNGLFQQPTKAYLLEQLPMKHATVVSLIRPPVLAAVVVSWLLLAVAPHTSARETEHFFEVSQAVTSKLGRTRLLEVPFYMKGQEGAPEATQSLGTWTQERSTRGVMRTDKTSCDVAFLSALIALQESAKKDGADAIVNLVSATRGKTTESPTHYRCISGATIAHVALTGDIIKTR